MIRCGLGRPSPRSQTRFSLDNQALTWLHQHSDLPTALLRPCNVIGPRIRNAMSRFIRQRSIPVIMGFDPMTQFVDQRDLTGAIVEVCEAEARGVFNVTGRGSLPLREALNATGAWVVPVPGSFASAYLRTAGLLKRQLPTHLIDFFKYPCVISDRLLRETFGWESRVGQIEAIHAAVGR